MKREKKEDYWLYEGRIVPFGPWDKVLQADDYEIKQAVKSKYDGSWFYIREGYSCPRCSTPVGEVGENGVHCPGCDLGITLEGAAMVTRGDSDYEWHKKWMAEHGKDPKYLTERE